MDNKSPNKNNDNNSNNNKKRPGAPLIILVLSIMLSLVFWQGYKKIKESGKEEISYSEFLTMLENDEVGKTKIYNEKIEFEPSDKLMEDKEKAVADSYVVVRTDDYSIVERLYEAGVEFEEVDEGGNYIISTIINIRPKIMQMAGIHPISVKTKATSCQKVKPCAKIAILSSFESPYLILLYFTL